MFLEDYLDRTKLNLLYATYEEWYIEGLDKENFLDIYNLFKKYNFYFIEDIILNYLEIFSLSKEEVEKEILDLKEELGEQFVYIIGNDMRYLEKILM